MFGIFCVFLQKIMTTHDGLKADIIVSEGRRT